ncbi:HlyD family efflux transporter periplasmic adaptor subunit [Novispirillum sp. DQ9]|uniref:HlyD family efflux transporter periplasmic adaptor subunit n=1 Tax=Novispirillum sp. DQ9 TaxID=3398612 RepID=UPI003C7DE65B
MTAAPSLPPLREEVGLFPGPRDGAGAPTWVLHDPVANRFFQIGWAAFEMLSRWGRGDPATVAAEVAAATPLAVAPADVEELARFLAGHDLIQVAGPQAVARLVDRAAARRLHWAAWLLKNYLFLRLPLVRPDRALQALLPWVGWLFSPAFLAATVLAGLAGLLLVARQWDAFLATFPHFFSPQGALLFGVALGLSKVLHELGHAVTARRHGCRVPTMGVAFLVMWPVLYTDTGEAWKLASRRARMEIGAAGMAAELVLAAWATLAWSFLPDGPLRSAVFVLASSTWLVTLAVNLNPLMRFDGYYLLADGLGVANLQARAFALARWRLREALFGLCEPPPEKVPEPRARVLLLYAYATWIYRFFLFLGIALLVYHLFFKALGLALMVVELVWFIGRPIALELREWARRRAAIAAGRRTRVTAAAGAALLLLAVIPWQGSVPAPAVWRAERQARLFTAQAGQVAELPVPPGLAVAEGAVLLRLASPDLDHAVAQGARRLEALEWQVRMQGLDAGLRERSQVSVRELAAEGAAQAGRLAEQRQLEVRAPFAGMVVEVAEPLAPGQWLAARQAVAVLVNPAAGVLEAFVEEGDLGRVGAGAWASFHPDDPARPVLRARVLAVDAAATRVLAEPTLASVHGGPIAVREGQDGALVPETPVYRVLLVPDQPLPAPLQVQRGLARIDADQASLAGRAVRFALAILIRESGF